MVNKQVDPIDCICGTGRSKLEWAVDGVSVAIHCPNCGRTGPSGYNEFDAMMNWTTYKMEEEVDKSSTRNSSSKPAKKNKSKTEENG